MAEHPSSSLTGRQFGDYRILSPLGTGGMGAVYAAEDVRLHRKVAIKFLTESLGDGEAKQRLFHEARAAAAIDHPNICTIYDVGEAEGQTFIVMQHVEGQTLAARLISGPMGIDQAVDVAAEIATALVEAHARGIVHRDVKPQNIMLASRGHVKVLDFGVARITPTFDDDTVTASGLKGIDGGVAGTIPYMSPEQIRNEKLDGRSDVFSLGIVLHELVTGTRPFGGSGSPDTIAAILTKEPPPFGPLKGGPSPELERIVRKCLEKDRELRYQSARELLADLRRLRRDSNHTAAIPQNVRPAWRGHTTRYVLAAAVLAAVLATGVAFFRWSLSDEVIGSLAILPLTSVNVAPALSYQTESITGGLIETLSRLPDLKVMSRNAVLRYQGREIDAQTVGRELGVEAVVAGRLAGNGDVLTLDLELVDAVDNSHVWGKRYEVTAANLLRLQREIPAELSEMLRPQAASVTLTRRDTADPEAHRLYSLARESFFKWSQDGSRIAVEYFKKAIDRDPSYALAYAGMAGAYISGNGTGMNPKDAHRLGRAAALKALALDPNLGEAHAALGGVLLKEDWDFAGAERELRRAIQLNPNDELARHSYSHFLLTVGRPDEAFAESRKVDELNPVDTLATGHYAYYYLATRQFDRAIEYYNRYFKVEKGDPASLLQFADALYQKGAVQEALNAYVKGHEVNKATEAELAVLKDAIAKRGPQGYLRTRIAQLEARGQPEPNVFPMTSLGGQLASLYARLGDKDRAFQQLERMYVEHDEACVPLLEESSFHPLYSDPRFAALLRRIGLPPPSLEPQAPSQ